MGECRAGKPNFVERFVGGPYVHSVCILWGGAAASARIFPVRPSGDPQSQFTGTVFEGLHITVACRGGSQAEAAPDFLQRHIVSRFGAGQIQLGRRVGVDDFFLTQLRKKRNRYLHLSVREGIHKRV